MTNEEAIQQLNFIKRVDNHVDTKEAIDIILNIIQENTELKAENERLKELMPKMCETCEYEDEIGYEEPCNGCNNRKNWKLKSWE